MFGKFSDYDYERVPQRDGAAGALPGGRFRLSSDYVPGVSQKFSAGASQGFLSWLCNIVVTGLVFLFTVVTFPVSGWFVLKTVPNYERIVLFRLGRIRAPKGPGVVLVLPLIDQWQRVDLRTRAFSIPPCRVSTKDGGLVSVGADIQFRIWNPVMSVVSVKDLNASTRLTAQNAMMQSLSKKTVKEIQTERVKLGEHLGMDMNELTQPWGLEVDRVELMLEAVLREPDGHHAGHFIMPPSVPGLEGLAGPIQQLATHFLNLTAASQRDHDTVSFSEELCPETAAVDKLLLRVRSVLSEDLVSRVRSCFQFYITTGSGREHSYYVDLSRGSGACGAGLSPGEPDVWVWLSEAELLAVFQGGVTPLAAYSSGRLRLQGDVNAAVKLQTLVELLKPT